MLQGRCDGICRLLRLHRLAGNISPEIPSARQRFRHLILPIWYSRVTYPLVFLIEPDQSQTEHHGSLQEFMVEG